MLLADWWFAPAPPVRLAMWRCLVGSYAVVFIAARSGHFLSPLAFSPEQFEPVGVLAWLQQPLPASALYALLALALGGSLAFAVGWRFRFSAPLFAVALWLLTTYRHCWSMIFHTDNLLVLHVGIVAFSPAADAFSLDARRRDTAATPDPRYGWPLRLCSAVVVLAYSIAALAKLRHSGLAWLQPSWLRYWVAYDNLRKVELGHIHSPLGVWLLPHAWLFTPMSLFSILVELLAPLALLGGAFAWAWTVSACLFHWGVLLLMAIAFPYPMSFVAFAPFFQMEKILDSRWVAMLRSKLRPRSSLSSTGSPGGHSTRTSR